MEFILKKVLATLLLPLPISLACITMALLLLWVIKKQTAGYCFLTLGLLILFTFSTRAVSSALIQSLESTYQPLQTIPSNVRQIVVLGGGIIRGNTDFPPNTRLSSASLSRLIEAIRLYDEGRQTHQNLTLILSGGRVFSKVSEAGRMHNTAVLLGVNSHQLTLENGSKDTHDEALYIKRLVKNHPFILVTSAYHMKRAMALFTAFGMHPIPAPTQYLTGSSSYPIARFLPNTKSLSLTDTAIHEYLGLCWIKLISLYHREANIDKKTMLKV